MSKIKLDLSQFKHVSSNDKTTTLRHKDGHDLVLAHNALSKEGKSQLEALSKMSAEHQTETQSNEAKAKMAKGGKVHKDEFNADDHMSKLSPEQVHIAKEKLGTLKEPKFNGYGKEADAKNAEEQDARERNMREKNKMAEGGKVDDKKPKESPETIKETSAANGVEAANAVRKDKKLPHGATILIEKVKKYAEGGMIDGILKAVEDYHNAPDPDRPKAEVNRDPNKQKAAQVSKEVRGYAEGGEIPDYLSGKLPEEVPSYLKGDLPQETDPVQDAMKVPQNLDTDSMINRSIETEKSKIKSPDMEGVYTGQDPTIIERQAVKNLADKQDADKMSAHSKEAEDKFQLDRLNEERVRAGLPTKAMPQAETPSQMAQPPQAPSQGIAPQSQTPTVSQGLVSQGMSTDPETMIHQGYQDVKQGITDEAKAVGELGKQQAQLIDQTNQAKQQAMETFEAEKSKNFAERDALVQDIKDGQIDPNRFWTGDKEGNGSHSKIAAGIGMILAGFNPTDRPNAAIDFLNKQMDMNLQAQMRNLGSKESLLSHNMAQFKNIKDASEFTRIQMNDVLQHQLESAAATAKSPLAQAAAKQAAGKLAMDSSNLFMNFAMRRAMMNLSGGSSQNPQAIEQMMGYMRAVNPEMAKSMEQRYVPGVGLGSIPVPETARKEIMGHQNLQAATQDLLNFTKQHTTLNPLSKEYAVGEQKARVLQSMVREGLLGTVYREGEQPLLDKFVSTNPGGALKMLNNAKMVELLHSNDRQANILRKQYGLPQVTSSQDNTPVKGRDGRMYIKQGNFMVPVK